MDNKLVTLLTALILPAALPVQAHHSFSAEFDGNKNITLTGTVVGMEWVNPHTWLHIAVENPIIFIKCTGMK